MVLTEALHFEAAEWTPSLIEVEHTLAGLYLEEAELDAETKAAEIAAAIDAENGS